MSEKTVVCPSCFGELNTPASLEGKEVKCPLCQKNFVVKFITEEPAETQKVENTFKPRNTKDSGLKIIETQTNNSQDNKAVFLPISLVILILLLMGGNGLLIFCMQKNQENIQRIEREIKTVSENISEKLSSVVNIAQTVANPVYEYKVATVKSTYSSKHEAIIAEVDLHKILARYSDWELIETITEIATEHPNFGNSEYVTGLQPDVRTQQVKLIFRRKINNTK